MGVAHRGRRGGPTRRPARGAGWAGRRAPQAAERGAPRGARRRGGEGWADRARVGAARPRPPPVGGRGVPEAPPPAGHGPALPAPTAPPSSPLPPPWLVLACRPCVRAPSAV